jgi:hypothetical protein
MCLRPLIRPGVTHRKPVLTKSVMWNIWRKIFVPLVQVIVLDGFNQNRIVLLKSVEVLINVTLFNIVLPFRATSGPFDLVSLARIICCRKN